MLQTLEPNTSIYFYSETSSGHIGKLFLVCFCIHLTYVPLHTSQLLSVCTVIELGAASIECRRCCQESWQFAVLTRDTCIPNNPDVTYLIFTECMFVMRQRAANECHSACLRRVPSWRLCRPASFEEHNFDLQIFRIAQAFAALFYL
jgi:hypothetical protein